MARSRAIDTRLEKLVPSEEEYVVTGVYTREEVHQIIRKRTNVEYRLVAKPLLLLDVRQAIELERDIERKIVEHCAHSKVVLKHRWVVQERIEQIFKIGLKHLRDPEERESLRRDFVAFLKTFRRAASLSQHYSELVVKNPLNPSYWVEATLWIAESGEIDNARTTIQQAIKLNPAAEEVYVCALTIELQFTGKLLSTIAKEHRDLVEATIKNKGAEVPDVVSRLRKENTALAAVAIDLALCRVVFDDILERDSACTPSLLMRLYDAASLFPFAKDLCWSMVTGGVQRRMLPAFAEHRGISGASWQNAWRSPASGQLLAKAVHHEFRSREKKPPHHLTSAELYLREQASLERPAMVGYDDSLKEAQIHDIGCAVGVLYSPAWKPHAPLFQQFVVSSLESVLVDMVRRTRKARVTFLEPETQQALFKQLLSVRQGQELQSLLHSVGQILIKSKSVSTTIDSWLTSSLSAGHLWDHSRVGDDDNTVVIPEWPSTVALSMIPAAELAQIQAVHRSQSSAAGEVEVAKHVQPISTVDVETTLIQLLGSSSSRGGEVDASDTMLALLMSHGLVGREVRCVADISHATSAPLFTGLCDAIPCNAWPLFFVAEQQTAACKFANTVVSGNATDSDDEDVASSAPPTKRPRTEPVRMTHGGSIAALGISILGRKIAAKLSAEDNILRAAAIFRLSHLLARRIIQVETLDAETVAARLSSISNAKQERSDVIATVKSLFSFVEQYQPVPRQYFTEVVVPFLEGVALTMCEQQSKQGLEAALRESRNAHEKAIALHRIAMSDCQRSAVRNMVFSSTIPAESVRIHIADISKKNQRGASTGCTLADSETLNAQDWCSYIHFERVVANDLRKSHQLTERARREALDPRQVLSILSTVV